MSDRLQFASEKKALVLELKFSSKDRVIKKCTVPKLKIDRKMLDCTQANILLILFSLEVVVKVSKFVDLLLIANM